MPSAHLRSLLLGLVALCSLVLSAADGPILMTPLVWKPTSALLPAAGTVNLTPFANVKIAFQPLADHRTEKGLLGENVEKAKPRFVGTSDDVALFVTKRLLALLQEPGLPLAEKAEGATTVLSGDLLRFHVTEKDTYQGEFRAMLQIQSEGKLLWKGLAVGQATRFGRSYKAENYHEALCDSLVDAVSRLITDKGFLEALAGRPAGQAPPTAN